MVERNVLHVLIDTSYLWRVGFSNPDFRKLLLYCQEPEKRIRIFVPHIAWEERRTQLFDEVHSQVRKLRESVDALKVPRLGGIVIEGLSPLTINIWTDAEIDSGSRATMEKFADDNGIEVIALGSDHAERAWARYFNAEAPFDRREKRENRRKDIPDAWILESAIDLLGKHGELIALCCDTKLAKALESVGAKVFGETQPVLDLITPPPKPVTEASTEIRVSAQVTGKHAEPSPSGKLTALLTAEHDRLKDLEIKVLGYVGYLQTASKDQLFDLLSQGGTSAEIARNVAERLVIGDLITDTGNHYIPANKEACNLAADVVEPEIIKLLKN